MSCWRGKIGLVLGFVEVYEFGSSGSLGRVSSFASADEYCSETITRVAWSPDQAALGDQLTAVSFFAGKSAKLMLVDIVKKLMMSFGGAKSSGMVDRAQWVLVNVSRFVRVLE